VSGAEVLAYVRDHYGVPAWPGRRVVVDGNPGVIVGGQDARLLVRFADGQRLPAHPTWRVEYVDGES
jgi:hypothetical protein